MIPADCQKRLHQWVKDLVEEVVSIKLPRCYFKDDPNIGKLKLHVFTDASDKAMGVVGY